MLTSDVHFKADVVKKEDELLFSVDIEQKITIACKFHFLRGLKGLCQLESMRSEVMQITFNCQNSIVFNA